MSGRARRAVAAVALGAAALVALGAGRSQAGAQVPPPEDSVASALATARLALLVAGLVPTSERAVHTALARAGEACPADRGDAAERACVGLEVAPCARSLEELDAALGASARSPDALTAELARSSLGIVADATSRLLWARDAIAAGRCAPLAADGAIPARIVAAGDGWVEIRPLRALRAGRAYALTVAPSADRRVATLRASPGLPPPADPAAAPPPLAHAPVSEEAESARYERTLSGDGRALRFDGDGARALLRDVARAAAGTRDVGSSPAFRLVVPHAATAADLAELRLAFVPADGAAAARTIARFRTAAVRAPYARRRSVLAARRCAGDEGRPALAEAKLGLPGAGAAEVLRGSVRSLNVARRGDGEPEDHAVRVPFVLALPRDARDATPLVLLVHGHGSSAEAFLKAHAGGLLARGLAALAMDLPGHAARAGEGPFLDVVDPERLPASVQQAVTDVLALVRAARVCGFVLPDGRTYRPSEVLLLGYSVGSVVGTIARAVEPDLGATVLLAPGGELVEWPIAQAPKLLGAASYAVCRGGPQHGAACERRDACTPPGACIADPQLMLLRAALRFPYEHVLAPIEPMAFATERTGDASTAPLLLAAGALDYTLAPHGVARLADAYGLRPSSGGSRRRGHTWLVWWPDLGHELAADQRVKQQAYDFLASRGRRAP